MVRVALRGRLARNFRIHAKLSGHTLAEAAGILVHSGVAAYQEPDASKRQAGVDALADLIRQLPGVHPSVGRSTPEDAFWYVKFSLDRTHPLAWHVLQRLGFVFNYISLEFRYSTVFMPVSPPPYLNGGPEFLNWAVEAKVPFYDPRHVTRALRAELPEHLGRAKAWRTYDTE